MDSLIRGVPSWVPAFRALNPAIQDIEQEVEGTLVRSYERYDSIPFTQWHAFYDWTFRVAPEPEFSKLVGAGNSGRDRNDTGLGDDVVAGVVRYDRDTAIAGGGSINRTVDCEWDLGALGDDGPFLTMTRPDPTPGCTSTRSIRARPSRRRGGRASSSPRIPRRCQPFSSCFSPRGARPVRAPSATERRI